VHQLINGPEAFTPDGEFILGESDVRGFFVAAGFCAHGIAGAGGVGKVHRRVDRRRRAATRPVEEGHSAGSAGSTGRASLRAWRARTRSTARYYDIRYPNHERKAGGR
jgi:4-methylaminobutanoate oxidase (formaldehyde-forming)